MRTNDLQVDDSRMIAPVRAVDFAGRLRNLGAHQEQVPPHPPGDIARARASARLGKAMRRFSSTTLRANSQNATEERGQYFCAALTNLERQRLDDARRTRGPKINGVVDRLVATRFGILSKGVSGIGPTTTQAGSSPRRLLQRRWSGGGRAVFGPPAAIALRTVSRGRLIPGSDLSGSLTAFPDSADL